MGDYISLYPMSILLAYLGIENITPASEVNDSNKDEHMAIDIDFVDKFAREACLQKVAYNETIMNDINISNKKVQKLSKAEL